jgi:hypothetical protein
MGRRPTGINEINGNFLSNEEYEYLRTLVGSDVETRHEDWISKDLRRVSKAVWEIFRSVVTANPDSIKRDDNMLLYGGEE